MVSRGPEDERRLKLVAQRAGRHLQDSISITPPFVRNKDVLFQYPGVDGRTRTGLTQLGEMMIGEVLRKHDVRVLEEGYEPPRTVLEECYERLGWVEL